MGGSPRTGLVVVGGNYCFEVSGFESQHSVLDVHFFLLTCKNWNVCLKKTEDKSKEAGDGLFRKRISVNPHVDCNLFLQSVYVQPTISISPKLSFSVSWLHLILTN